MFVTALYKVYMISGHSAGYGVRLNTAKESLVHQGHKKCTNDMNPSFYQLQV